MRTRMRIIAGAAGLAVLTATAGAAAAAASTAGSSPSAAPSTVKPSPTGGAPTEDAFVHDLARILGITDARARQVLDQIQQISGNGNIGPIIDNPQFAAVAASLHITPQRLVDALTEAKMELAHITPPDPAKVKQMKEDHAKAVGGRTGAPSGKG